MSQAVEERIKAWLTPGLITCFGVVSWNLINEVRSDVKQLLEANAQVRVEIQNLKERVTSVESIVYSQRIELKSNEKVINK